MELFVASDDEQFEYIKRVIDNCDYYVLILGGRYGSISPKTNKSYTQMEYEYALEKNIPVLVFPFKNIETLPIEKRDNDLNKITEFLTIASKDRMCKFWTNKDQLILSVINSLYKIFEEKPQRGWIRPDEYDNTELLTEINFLRKRNQELEQQVQSTKTQPVKNIADMDELYEIHYRCYYQNSKFYSKSQVTWNQIFSYIAPYLINAIHTDSFKYKIDANFVNKLSNKNYDSVYLDNDDINTIKIQFLSHNLITIYSAKMVQDGIGEFIQLTQKGLQYLKQIKTVKTAKH